MIPETAQSWTRMAVLATRFPCGARRMLGRAGTFATWSLMWEIGADAVRHEDGADHAVEHQRIV